MLAKKFRLPSSFLLQNAHNMRSELFTVRYQKNDLPFSRFAFVVSKKIDKRAVVRNRLKRVVRQAVEAKWLTLPGWDMLFVLRPAIRQLTREKIQETVDVNMATLLHT